MQVVWRFLQQFRRFTVKMCSAHPKSPKIHQIPLFWGFKVVQDHRGRYPW